jgi:hypothetical protein
MLRPVVLDEDTIEYVVHLPRGADLELECQAMREKLWTCCPFLTSFVWQREPFALTVEEGRVCGSTAFGDSQNDEWFIVFLLVELSRMVPEAVVEVWDGDGQLLLIEAAMHLPEWLEPDTSEHRVFLFRGELQLVGMPEEGQAEQPFAPLRVTRESAVEIVRTYGPQRLTRASDAIQQCLAKRLAEMPQRALVENHHYCRLLLPLSLARALQQRPAIVAQAVEAFYYRDESEAQKLLRNRRELRFADESNVCVRVRFTRLLYVQMLQQSFDCPPHMVLPPEKDPLRRAAELGARLVCGFELLWSSDAKARETLKPLLESVDAVSEAEYDERDSDDSWMFVSPADVDDLLAPRESEAAQVKALMEQAMRVQEFVSYDSAGLDGAEPPEEEEEAGEENGDFDIRKFMNAVQRGLGLPESEIEDAGVLKQQQLMDAELQEHGLGENVAGDLNLNLVESIVKSHDDALWEQAPLQHLLRHMKK